MPARVTNAILTSDVKPQNGIDGNILYEDEEFRSGETDSEDEDEAEDNYRKFRPRPSLPDSDVFKRSLGDLMTQRMTGLINSLIENYYIPPIIFNKKREVMEDGTSRWKRICVDGKQRLSSVKAFMMGKIPCHDKAGNSWYYCERRDEDGNIVKHKGRRILPAHTKREFREKEFVCYEFIDLTSVQEEDLFARVQMGMSLTPAEKLRATNGPWQDFARLFEEDFRDVLNLSETGRSAGFRHLLACFSMILEVQHPSKADGKPILKQSPKDLERLTKNVAALDDATKSHLARVFTTFKELVEEDPQTFADNGYRNVKTFAPVEMVAVAILISMYGDTRNHQLLLGDIRDMRTTLRQNLQDLRLNSTTWNVVWEYLERLEQFRGAVDGSTAPIIRPKKKKPSAATAQPAISQNANSPIKHEKVDQQLPLRAVAPLPVVNTPAPAPPPPSHRPPVQNRPPTSAAARPSAPAPAPTPAVPPTPVPTRFPTHLPSPVHLPTPLQPFGPQQSFIPINPTPNTVTATPPIIVSSLNFRPTTTATAAPPAPAPARPAHHPTPPMSSNIRGTRDLPLFVRSNSPDSVIDLSDDDDDDAAPVPSWRTVNPAAAPATSATLGVTLGATRGTGGAPMARMMSAGAGPGLHGFARLPSRPIGVGQGGGGDEVERERPTSAGQKRRAEIEFGYAGVGGEMGVKRRG